MKPVDAARALSESASRMSRAVRIDTTAMMALAKQSAASANRAAQSSRDSIDIRVTQHSDGVRVSIRGPNALRYKSMMSRQMNAGMSNVKADIRARIVKQMKS